MQDLITIENLRYALGRVFSSEDHADEEWIDRIAEFIMDFFGYDDRILDNKLTPNDRDVFYMLESYNILKTEMEEATIQKGKIWRIHYWILNKDKIMDLLQEKDNDGGNENGEGNIYEKLSDNLWRRD